jgi:PAS domain S-box-containing protein
MNDLESAAIVKLLVIDDDEEDYQLLREVMADCDGVRFRSTWIHDFETAKAALVSGGFDVALIDYKLGVGDGLSLIEEASRRGCRAPMILMTGQSDRRIDLQATRAGAADFIPKGNIDPRLLERSIRYAMERSRSVEALRHSEERMRRLLETTHVIPWEMDAATLCFTYVGPQAVPILGYPIELWRQPGFWESHVHQDDLAESRRLWETARKGDEHELELRMLHPGGHVIWLRAVACPAPGDAGGSYLQGFLFDINDRKNAEEALRRSEEQLRQSQKMEAIGRLAGGVAHDFNNLLTAIIGYSDLWIHDPGDASRSRQYAEEIRKAAARASALTRQLLAFSRREFAKHQAVQLNTIVSEMHAMFHRLIPEDIEVVTELDPGLATILADPAQMEQVLLNLVVNARDSMPAGGRISIRTHHFIQLDCPGGESGLLPGPYVVLTVSDQGCGMDSNVMAHIFEPFFTTKELGKGTGLGLSMVYGIVQQCHGHIQVESQINLGTSFHLYFPAAGVTASAANRGAPPMRRTAGNETILLVEDEELVRDLVRQVLEAQGYRVIAACDGIEAIEISKDKTYQRIDLLLTDLVMPRLNGPETADRLIQHHPETRILYMSGYSEDATTRARVADTRTVFIRKPFTPAELTAKVREVLDTAHHLRAA